MEQTRQALGALATLCMDMGKVSALAEESASASGAPAITPVADFLVNLQALDEVKGAAWRGEPAGGAIASANHRDLAQAVAIAIKAAFDEDRDAPHLVTLAAGDALTLLAGSGNAVPSLQEGPDAPNARGVDFSKGGKGLKLIWAAFVLERHGVQTWTDAQRRASIGFRIPLVQA
jgi:hypothetical protein